MTRAEQQERRRSRRRVVVAALVVVLVPLALVAGWFWLQVHPWGDPGSRVRVTVPDGAGMSDIAQRLEDRGVIGSALAFRVWARLDGAGPIQAGTYTLRRDLGASDALAALGRGPEQHYVRLALPPGLTFAQVAARIAALPGRSMEGVLAAAPTVRSRYQPEGVDSLEGLTWPDTYLVEDHEDEADILRTIVGAFDTHATALGLDRAADPYERVIVASLIEREAGVDADRPLIAAVIRNRQRDGMPLQIDATVVYARGDPSGPLTDADFARDSPYNTYVVTGLPPTPIATVTEPSLAAALAPADVPYKYYVLTNRAGKHVFAVTLEEHERNVADARRRGVLP